MRTRISPFRLNSFRCMSKRDTWRHWYFCHCDRVFATAAGWKEFWNANSTRRHAKIELRSFRLRDWNHISGQCMHEFSDGNAMGSAKAKAKPSVKISSALPVMWWDLVKAKWKQQWKQWTQWKEADLYKFVTFLVSGSGCCSTLCLCVYLYAFCMFTCECDLRMWPAESWLAGWLKN